MQLFLFSSLFIKWQLPDRRVGSTILSIGLFDSLDFCLQSQTGDRSCANAKTKVECEGRCGIGTGLSGLVSATERNNIQFKL